MLEVDVVVDLLLTVGRCFGERNQQWPRVLLWFEGVAARSGASSFSFVTSMLSTRQKDAISAVLAAVESACAASNGSRAEEETSFAERLERVKCVYELN